MEKTTRMTYVKLDRGNLQFFLRFDPAEGAPPAAEEDDEAGEEVGPEEQLRTG